jgi:hypothetical protein
MAEQVVPTLDEGKMTDAAVIRFRESALRSWFWRSRLGEWLLKRFWRSRLGRWIQAKFHDASPEELHGYAYWGPVAVAIAATEILGALSESFRNWIPWPTISGTVGHLEDLNSLWGVAVVAVIATTAFYALSQEEHATAATKPVLRLGRFRLHYGWPLVLILVALVALVVRTRTEDKFHLAYAIYGSFAVFGIVLPMIFIWRKSEWVVFPGLFFTLRRLRERFRWIALAVIAGLSILLIHLALYPWPDLAREPATFAGASAVKARAKARHALSDDPEAKRPLIYTTQARNIVNGQNAWSVYFSELVGGVTTYFGCVVTVTATGTTLSDECLNG